jgi:hypothetical protein
MGQIMNGRCAGVAAAAVASENRATGVWAILPSLAWMMHLDGQIISAGAAHSVENTVARKAWRPSRPSRLGSRCL